MKQLAVAIDGPSGAGKSTVARAAAQKLGFVYVDTGALYRAIGWYAKEKGIALEDCQPVCRLLPEIKLRLLYDERGQRVLVNGRDVSEEIRTPEMSRYASAVSALAPVRQFLLQTQRDIAREHAVIMDGRDIGTVILPDAQVKIFLTASPEKRAERRYLEWKEKGLAVDRDSVLQELMRRVENDTRREQAPLRSAEDAVVLDTSELTLEESVERVVALVRAAMEGERNG